MRDDCFIVLSEYGIERMTKRQGSLKRGEVSVRVSVTINDSAFVDPPISASIVIPDNAIIHPRVDVQVADAPVVEPA